MGWARSQYADFNGRLLRNGVDWQELDADDLVDVIYTMIIEDIMNMEVSRTEARETIDKRLEDAELRAKLAKGEKPEAKPFVLDQAAMSRMGIKIPLPASKAEHRGVAQ